MGIWKMTDCCDTWWTSILCPECGDEIVMERGCNTCGCGSENDEYLLGVCLSCYINTLQYEIDEKLKEAQEIIDEVYDIDDILEHLL